MTEQGITMSLSELLAHRARTFGKKVCIKFKNKKISYEELDATVTLCSGGFQSFGLKTGDRIAILMHNCPEYIITYFSILRSACIALPLNIYLTAQEISYIIQDAECQLLIYSDSYALLADDVKKNVPGIRIVHFMNIPKVEKAVNTVQGDSTAVLLYTSGTTGFPKGAMLTHQNLILNAASCQDVMKITNRDKILLFLPLFHAFSFTVCVILPIYAGASIVLLKSVQPFSDVLHSLLRDRITYFVAVPTVYNILAKKRIPLFVLFLLKWFLAIKACVSGASALPKTTIDDFEKRFRVPLIEGYGLTEASPVVAVNPLYGKRKPLSVGPPIPGVEAMIIGEDGKSIPPGETGELIVRGPNVMKGYFRKREETDAVIKNGWLFTGDMAQMDEDGYIYIVDRKKDLIIVDGMNIYPREIEILVEQLDGIQEGAMVGIPDSKGSERTVLFMTKKDNAQIDEPAVRNFLREGLAKYKIPRRMIFIKDFPRTATGKIKKTELRKML